MKNLVTYIKHFALSIKRINHKKVLLLLLTLIVSIQPAKVFALKESEWDIFDINGIYYYDRDAENCVTSNLSGTIGKLYDGSEIISKSDLDKINANRPVYEKSAAIVTPSLILVKFPKLNSRGKLTLWPSSYKIITAPA